MAIEKITDENYDNFKNSSRAALVVGASWCQECERYNQIADSLAKQLPFIRFGKTVLDEAGSTQLKRDYTDIGGWTLPTTLLFKDQKEVSRINGVALYPNALSSIQENLISESTIFVPNGSLYVPATIKFINDRKSSYVLQLMENSPLGRKGATIELPEGGFSWNLESKV